jgi:hypothetical protein
MTLDALAEKYYDKDPEGRFNGFAKILLNEELRAALAQAREMGKQDALEENAKLRLVIDLAARTMGGEGVEDQGQAWDKTLRLLDSARADFPEGEPR